MPTGFPASQEYSRISVIQAPDLVEHCCHSVLIEVAVTNAVGNSPRAVGIVEIALVLLRGTTAAEYHRHDDHEGQGSAGVRERLGGFPKLALRVGDDDDHWPGPPRRPARGQRNEIVNRIRGRSPLDDSF